MMDLQTASSTTTTAATRARLRRRSLRRAVQLDVEVMSDLWEGTVPLSVTNLSLHGLWLESELALSVGDELRLAFEPPHWSGLPKLQTQATVARVSLLRRRRDGGHAGMGLCFRELSPVVLRCLDYALRGLPPPLPLHATRELARGDDSPVIRLDDGVCYVFAAEAPLLSAGRPIVSRPVSAPMAESSPLRRVVFDVVERERKSWREHSPMTAIFEQPRRRALCVAG